MLGGHRGSAAGKAGKQGKKLANRNASARQAITAGTSSAAKSSPEFNAALTAAAVAAAKAAIESPGNASSPSSGPSTTTAPNTLRRVAHGITSNNNAAAERRPSRSSTVLSAAPLPPSPASSSQKQHQPHARQQQQQQQESNSNSNSSSNGSAAMNTTSPGNTRPYGDGSTTQSLATSVNVPPHNLSTSTPYNINTALPTSLTAAAVNTIAGAALPATAASSTTMAESPLAGSHRTAVKLRDGISVVVRVRPLTIAEHADPSARNCVQCLKDYVIVGGVGGSGTSSSGVLTARTSEDKLKLSATKPAPALRPCQFGVDQVLHPHTTQIEVYERTCRDIVAGVFEGINGAILAYGATGSGKTHTMFGSALSAAGIVYQSIQDIFAEKRRLEEEEGCTVTVRCSFVEIYNEEVYDLLVTPRRSGQNNANTTAISSPQHQTNNNNNNSSSSPTKAFASGGGNNGGANNPASSPTNNAISPRRRATAPRLGGRSGAKPGTGLAGRTALQVRENVADDASVNPESLNISNLTYAFPDSLEAFSRAIEFGHANRFTAATGANSESSRSHAIITVEVRVQPRLDAVAEASPINTTVPVSGAQEAANDARAARGTLARIQFCDLAGSERAASTSNTGIRLREGGNINRSLLALGAVVQSLVQRRRFPDKQIFVPYRGSKLTRLLRDGLSGNCRTQIIFCLSPCNHQYEESLNTMLFAMQAKEVQIAARRNVFTVNTAQVAQNQERLIEELRAELYAAQQELARLGGNVPASTNMLSASGLMGTGGQTGSGGGGTHPGGAHGVVEARLSACSASGGAGFERGQSPVLVSVEGSAMPAIVSARGTRPTCMPVPLSTPPPLHTPTMVNTSTASPRLRDLSATTSPAESAAVMGAAQQGTTPGVTGSAASIPLGQGNGASMNNNSSNTNNNNNNNNSATLSLQKTASTRSMLPASNTTGGTTASRASRASVFTEGRLCFTELEDKLKNYTQQKDTLYRQMRDAQEQRSERDIVLRQYKWKLARFLASNALAGNKAGRSGEFATSELRGGHAGARDGRRALSTEEHEGVEDTNDGEDNSRGLLSEGDETLLQSAAHDGEDEGRPAAAHNNNTTFTSTSITSSTQHPLAQGMGNAMGGDASGARTAPSSTVGIAGLRNVIATMEAEGQALDAQLELLNTQLNRVDRELAEMLKELVREKQPASLELLLDNTKLRHNCTEAECLAAHFHQESRVAQNTTGEYAQALEMCVGALRAVLPHLPPRSAVQDEVRRALLYAPLPALPTAEMITSFESALKAESTPPLAPPLAVNSNNNSSAGGNSPGTALFFSPRQSRTLAPNANTAGHTNTTNSSATMTSSATLLPRSCSPRMVNTNIDRAAPTQPHGPMRRHYYHHHNSHRGENKLDWGTHNHMISGVDADGVSPTERESYEQQQQQQEQELSAEMMTLEQHFRELTRDVAQSEATARARRAAMRGGSFASARPRRGNSLLPPHSRTPGLYDTSQTCRAALGRENILNSSNNKDESAAGGDGHATAEEDKTRAFTRLNAKTRTGSPELSTLQEVHHTEVAAAAAVVLPQAKDARASARGRQAGAHTPGEQPAKALPQGKAGNNAVSARHANNKRTPANNNNNSSNNSQPVQDNASKNTRAEQQRRQLYSVFGGHTNTNANATNAKSSRGNGAAIDKPQAVTTRRRMSLTTNTNTNTNGNAGGSVTTTPTAVSTPNTSLTLGSTASKRTTPSTNATTRAGRRARGGGAERGARSNNTNARNSPTNNAFALTSPRTAAAAAAGSTAAKNATRAPRAHRTHNAGSADAALPAPLPFRRLHTDASENVSRARGRNLNYNAASSRAKPAANTTATAVYGSNSATSGVHAKSSATGKAMTMNTAWAAIAGEDIRRGHSPPVATDTSSNAPHVRFARSNSLPYTSHGLLNASHDTAAPAVQPFTRTQAMTLLGTPSKAAPPPGQAQAADDQERDEAMQPLQFAPLDEKHVGADREAAAEMSGSTEHRNHVSSSTITGASEPSPSHSGSHRRTSVVTKVPPTTNSATTITTTSNNNSNSNTSEPTRLSPEHLAHPSRESSVVSELPDRAASLSSTLVSPLAQTTNTTLTSHTLGATMAGASSSSTAALLTQPPSSVLAENSPLTRTSRAISRGASSTSVGLDCVSVSSSSTDASVTTSVHRVVRSKARDEREKKANTSNSNSSSKRRTSKERPEASAAQPVTTSTSTSHNTVTNEAPSLLAQGSRRRGVTKTSPSPPVVISAAPMKLVAMPTEEEDGCSTRSLSDSAPSSDPTRTTPTSTNNATTTTTTTTITSTTSSSNNSTGEIRGGRGAAQGRGRGGGVVASLRQMFSKVKGGAPTTTVAAAVAVTEGKENHVVQET